MFKLRVRRFRVSVILVLTVGAAGWNIVVPGADIKGADVIDRSACKALSCRSSTAVRAVKGRRYTRSQLLPGVGWLDGRQSFHLPTSISETVEQELTPSNGEPPSEEARHEPKPFPRVGDVVCYQGKWADEIYLGEIRQLQRVEQTGEWRAYVLDLEEIGNGEYTRKKNRRSKAEDITKLRPVRAFYVRSVDGFKVRFPDWREQVIRDSETKEPRYLSDGYTVEGFELPKVEMNPAKLAADLESYEDLKRRLVLDTASFGAVGALVAVEVFGANRGVMFALGSLAAVGYVIILENTADNIASGEEDTITTLKGNARFAMPILAVGTIALKNYISNPETTKFLSLLTKEDFAAVMLGFVTPSRLPLLYREIRASLKGEEILDMLPGSIGQGRSIIKNMADEGVVAKEPRTLSAKVIVVSGPRYLGKTSLVKIILSEDGRLTAPVWCTTRPMRSSEVDGQDFNFLKPIKFEELQRKGSFVYTYEDQDESYGLRVEDILAVSERGKICIIDANMALVKSLMGITDFEMIGVWVSLDSIEAIEDRIKTTLIDSGGSEDSSDLTSEVHGIVRQAVDDIEFGVMSGVFDFTVINNSEVEESMETIRRAIAFASESS